MQTATSVEPGKEPRGSDRRRPDWEQNDRRQLWPWVMDSNDRRSGNDRRLEERRDRELARRKAEIQ